MSLKCLFGHKWNGCKCERCGAARDEKHRWSIIEDKCIEKCSICGKERRVEHKWHGYQCERCGATHDGGVPLKEICSPELLHSGDIVRLFAKSLPYTFEAGWLDEPYMVSHVDLEKKRITFVKMDKTTLLEKKESRTFGDTFYGYNGCTHIHCYKLR